MNFKPLYINIITGPTFRGFPSRFPHMIHWFGGHLAWWWICRSPSWEGGIFWAFRGLVIMNRDKISKRDWIKMDQVIWILWCFLYIFGIILDCKDFDLAEGKQLLDLGIENNYLSFFSRVSQHLPGIPWVFSRHLSLAQKIHRPKPPKSGLKQESTSSSCLPRHIVLPSFSLWLQDIWIHLCLSQGL